MCTDNIEPIPVNCTGASAARHNPFSRSRSASPRAFSATAASGVKISVSPAIPAAMVSTLLLNVPACGSASGRRGSNMSMISARPPNAPNDIPPPIYLPKLVRSGFTPRTDCSPPGASREVITSSRISSAPAFVAASRSACRNAGSAAMHPPPPIIGSRMIAASFSAFCCTSASVPSISLYGATTKSNGALIRLPPEAK